MVSSTLTGHARPAPIAGARQAALSGAGPHRPHPNHDVPDNPEPGSLPVEPDQGPVPAAIPDDPEGDRVTEPAT